MARVKKKKSLVQVLGPVESLESYVKADWWREIFNANYLRTDGDVVNDSEITVREVDQIVSWLNLPKESYILDLCCGQGRHTMELGLRGYSNTYGLDRSHYLITRAKKQSREKGLNICFREGDARRLPYKTDYFDFILILGNSFGYFDLKEDDLKVLHEVFRVLKPDGQVLIDITDGEYIRSSFEPRSWEWIDKNFFVCRERSLSNSDNRLISREVITHVKKGVIADQFYAERLYSKNSIQKLLKEAGFIDVDNSRDFQPASKRNQDLGMMARRIIVTGRAVKAWSVKKEVKKLKSIVVILGDPRYEDRVKPHNKFDEDDYHTISELKKALGELPEFHFKYFNNHKALIQLLIKEKTKIDFVFNLCDEGFNNEAVQELHVPALLEMLGIPYTGGTPQCLAFCYDKSLVRGIAKELDIPVPEAYVIKPENTTFIELPLQLPVIVKPNIGDSSFGITKDNVCHSIEALENIIVSLRETIGPESNILVEEFLTGMDLTVGIIGNLPDEYTVLPIIEEDYSDLPEHLPRICGYEAKWDQDSPYWKCLKSIPADLPEATERYLVACCLKLFERLECRDYARLDWRLDKHGTPRLLEVNPNPGWCWDGHIAKMSKLADLSYSQMLLSILNSAEARILKVNHNSCKESDD